MVTDKDDKKIKDTFEALGVTAGTPGPETYYGESADESSTTDTTKRIDVLEQKTEKLEDKASQIEKSLLRSEKNQDKAINFIMGIAGVIIVAFFLAIIPLLFDYYKNNAERYENYTRRIDKLDMRLEILENK
jgi:hypothetical protein